jgi:hypothetical protein
MHIVYWAHSYRDEDAAINRHFGTLIEAERMIVNFDPPSKSVNESKLDQNLRSCDGMVAVLTWRANGPSQYILHEIGLCLRSRKPLLVFVDDRLPGEFLPPRVLQRRFSHRTYFRQVREHRDAMRTLKTYMGDPPPSRYQPSAGQRTCGLIGFGAQDGRTIASRLMQERGYRVVELEKIDDSDLFNFEKFEHLANLDVALRMMDSKTRRSIYWAGALSAAAVPSISVTTNADYPFREKYPLEFQPRPANVANALSLDEVVAKEFDLYEQDFLKVESAEAIERYTKMQLQAGALDGHYEVGTRGQFVEYVMGDKYNISGQAGAVGPGAHAHDMNFSQVWNRLEETGNISRLADELSLLRKAMEHEASDPGHKIAIAAVDAAEQSARQNDGPKAIEYLKTAGKWALGVAEKIGVDFAKEAIKGALGF